MAHLQIWLGRIAWFAQAFGISAALWAVGVAAVFGTTAAFGVALGAVIAMLFAGILRWVAGFLSSLNS